MVSIKSFLYIPYKLFGKKAGLLMKVNQDVSVLYGRPVQRSVHNVIVLHGNVVQFAFINQFIAVYTGNVGVFPYYVGENSQLHMFF